MPLLSQLLRTDRRLQACAVDDHAHVTPGSKGDFVVLIQKALLLIDSATIADDEFKEKLYGQTTAEAVLSYKRKRRIINFSYQSSADNIVGKMTIASLDKDMVAIEARSLTPVDTRNWSILTYRGRVS